MTAPRDEQDIWVAMEQRPLRVRERLCARTRSRRASCRACLAVCPVEAVTLDDGLQVDARRCESCRLCAAVCPTGALAADSPGDVAVAAQLRQDAAHGPGPAMFACSRCADGRSVRGATLVPCLGRLDVGLLLYAASTGRDVRLVDGPCADCPWRIGRDIASAAAETANAVLAAAGSSRSVRFVADLSATPAPAEAPGSVSRRGFLRSLFRETARVAANAIDSALDLQPGDADAAAKLPAELPDRARLLQAAVRRLLNGAPQGAAEAVARGPWGALEIGAACNGCGLCATFCPTGALTKVEQDGRAGVAFRPAACLRCGLCEDVCIKRALTIGESVQLGAVSAGAAQARFLRDAEAVPGWTATTRRRIMQEFRTR